MAHTESIPVVHGSAHPQLQACASSQMSMYHTLYPHDHLVQVCRAVALYVPLPPVQTCHVSGLENLEIHAQSNGHTTSCDQLHNQKPPLPPMIPSKHHTLQSTHAHNLVGAARPASSSW